MISFGSLTLSKIASRICFASRTFPGGLSCGELDAKRVMTGGPQSQTDGSNHPEVNEAQKQVRNHPANWIGQKNQADKYGANDWGEDQTSNGNGACNDPPHLDVMPMARLSGN